MKELSSPRTTHLLAHVSSLKDAGDADIETYPRPDPPQQLDKDVRAWLLPEGAEYGDGAYWAATGKPGAKYESYEKEILAKT